VEDWFQVENFKPYIPYSSWDSRELRVEKNTHRLLDLFDSIRIYPVESERHSNGANNQLSAMSHELGSKSAAFSATFFILGWIAERLPGLVKEIHSRGHEIASHGFAHDLANRMGMIDLEADLNKSKKVLEDITGEQVSGFRAPSFSLSREILSMVENCGYLYDSSYNSFALHGRYGKVDLLENKGQGLALKISDSFFELPVSNFTLGTEVVPWGGGGYFRLIPFPVFMKGVRRILKKQGGYLFYVHPWEIDPDQPRVDEASPSLKFKHYTGIKRNFLNLSKFLERLRGNSFLTCRQYIDQLIDEK
jgi:polysaccharide deacetylase family protein (PEP-CTERM system associated)